MEDLLLILLQATAQAKANPPQFPFFKGEGKAIRR
jgi:hypothetical protein